jgi:signal transduction histidine kinase
MSTIPVPCEMLEDRLSAIHRASLELVQEISLDALLERIATTACEQTRAEYCAVGTLNDNGDLDLFIPVGMSGEEITRIDSPPHGNGLLGKVIKSRQVITTSDILSDPRMSGFPENHPPMTSFLGVPIYLGERTLGLIYLTNKIDEAEFTLDDQEVIETLAGYAAVAISNAHLYRDLVERDHALTQRNENLALLNDLAPILATSTDVDQILNKTLSRVMDYLDLETGDIFLRQEESRTLTLVIHEGNMTCNPTPFDELQMQFLTAISSWLGTALENMRLNLQQRRLAVLEERERIGMDLHDGIIQSIYAVGLTLEHVRLLLNDDPSQVDRRIQQAISDLNNTIRDLRAYILDLRPRQLYDENLIDGIIRLVSEFRANTLVDVKLQGSTQDFFGLPHPQALALFHICQEALANIAKHARAKHVTVTLWRTADRALLEVSDDGAGFEVKKVRFTLGHGLSNMKTRSHNAGGDIEFSSEPGKGSTILTWVPLSNET